MHQMRTLLIVVGVLLSFDGNEGGLVRRYANGGQELLIPVAVITDEANAFSATDFSAASSGSEVKVQPNSVDSAATTSKASERNPADVSVQENEVGGGFVNKLYEQKTVKHQHQQEQKPLEVVGKTGENSVLSFVEPSREAEVQQAGHAAEEVSVVKKADASVEQEQQLRLSTVDPVATEGDVASADGQTLEGQDVTQLRQSNQAAPVQTTPGNFVQQLIQNSPLRPIFNQLTGQNAQVAGDEAAGTTSPPALPGFFNPIQTVVNTTTQAFQGLQQFASNLGSQFQNTLSTLGGQGQQTQAQAQDAVASTNRPPGPLQQFVSNFIGGNSPSNPQQQTQAQSQPQRPLQNIFQGIFQGNRPQQTASNNNKPANSENSDSQSSGQPAELSTLAADTAAADAGDAAVGEGNESNPVIDPIEDDKNKRRKRPVEDSFEDGDSDTNEEVIVVNDENAPTVNHHHYFHHQYDRPDGSDPSDPGYSAAVPY